MANTPEEWSRVVASPLLVGMVAQKAAEAGTEGEFGLWRSSRQRCGESHCSEKGNHAGYGRPDAQSMKLFRSDLPDELQRVVSGPSL